MHHWGVVFIAGAVLAIALFCVVIIRFYALYQESKRDPRIRNEGMLSLFIVLMLCCGFFIENLRVVLADLGTNSLGMFLAVEYFRFIVEPLMIIPLVHLAWIVSSFRLPSAIFLLRLFVVLGLLTNGVFAFHYRVSWDGSNAVVQDAHGFDLYEPGRKDWYDALGLVSVSLVGLMVGAYVWVRTSIIKEIKTGLDSYPLLFIVALACVILYGAGALSHDVYFYTSNWIGLFFAGTWFLTYRATIERGRLFAHPFENVHEPFTVAGSPISYEPPHMDPNANNESKVPPFVT